MAQKVITVNISIAESGVENEQDRNWGHEIESVNKYLDQGWSIEQTIHTVPQSNNSFWTNITFILVK